MLGTTASGLYWMFRHLERTENTARLIEAGLRISLTRSSPATDEWASLVTTAGATHAYEACHDTYTPESVIDFLLRSPSNPSSVLSLVESARSNGRRVRTALTREVWEATNECAMTLRDLLSKPVQSQDLPRVLAVIRRESAYVRGAHHGTMMRNENFNFARLGTFVERADNTIRILDVKYYVLLPTVSHVGSILDNLQWETILRSVSAQRAYRWARSDDVTAAGIAEFVILDPRLPRSLVFCYQKMAENLEWLADRYGERHVSQDQAAEMLSGCAGRSINDIFDYGLHEFLSQCLIDTANLGRQIEIDYRFVE